MDRSDKEWSLDLQRHCVFPLTPLELLPSMLEEYDPLVVWSKVDNNRLVEQTGPNLKFRVQMSLGA